MPLQESHPESLQPTTNGVMTNGSAMAPSSSDSVVDVDEQQVVIINTTRRASGNSLHDNTLSSKDNKEGRGAVDSTVDQHIVTSSLSLTKSIHHQITPSSSSEAQSSYVPPQPQTHQHPPHFIHPIHLSYPPPNGSNVSTVISIQRHVIRTQAQLQVMRHGSRFIVIVSLALLIAAYALLGLEGGIGAIVLFTLSLLPVFVILGTLRLFSSCNLSIALMVEMFWSGALLSILVASILELISEFQTHHIWECQSKNPSISCDLRFIIVVIVGVGLVEEFSKFLPLSRIKNEEADVPTHHVWWFRLIDSPQSLALAGLCSAAGFAGIENIKYVFTSGAEAGIGTSLWRAVLAIPFHLACTTYASCQLAKLMFKPTDEPQEESSPNQPPELVSLTRESPSDGMINNAMMDSGQQHTVHHHHHYKHVSFLEYLKCLVLPSVLHGFYDVGLFLAVQLMGLSEKGGAQPSVPASLSWLQWIGTVPMFATDISSKVYSPTDQGNNDLYETLAICCLGLSLGSYILILVLSFWAWKDLKLLPVSRSPPSTPDVPYIVHYDQFDQVQVTSTSSYPSHQLDTLAENNSLQSSPQDFNRQPIHSSARPQWFDSTSTNTMPRDPPRSHPRSSNPNPNQSSSNHTSNRTHAGPMYPMSVEDRREYFEQ